jgi:hypothetical protein
MRPERLAARAEDSPRLAEFVAAALALAGAAGFVAVLVRVWPFTADDAFIWFRYARNLAAGHGPRFNPGDPPAEGYTGFLWLLLLTLPHAAGLDAPLFAKCVGVAATVGTLAVTWRFAFELAGGSAAERRLAGSIAVLALGVLPATAIHAVSGMETALYAFLLQLFLYALTRAAARPGAPLPALAPLGLAVGLTRPEGNLLVATGLAVLLVLLPAPPRARLLRSCAWAWLLPGALYFGWRLWYYGVLLPLPFYVVGNFGTARPGTQAVGQFLAGIAPAFALPVLLGLARSDRRLLPAAASSVALLVFFLFPVHRMSYAFRYLHPVVPFACVLSGVGIAGLLRFLRSRIASPRPRELVSLAALALVLAAMLRLAVPPGAAGAERATQFYAVGLKRSHVALGQRLAAMVGDPAHPPTLAIADAGAVPYYSGWRTIDTVGLNDAHIALNDDHSAAYVFSQRPDLVVLLSRRRDTFDAILPWADELLQACRAARMERLAVFGSRRYWLWVMGDPGSRFAAGLAEPADRPGSRGG